jgi:Ni/Co efflux regulator RcnB
MKKIIASIALAAATIAPLSANAQNYYYQDSFSQSNQEAQQRMRQTEERNNQMMRQTQESGRNFMCSTTYGRVCY